MTETYTVRTIFLQNYFAPASNMANMRRGKGDTGELVGAMKRTELADNTLARELNGFAERGYHIMNIIPHPIDAENPYDLLITVVLSKDES
ncbi:MAG: hypothetical protein AAFV93_25220 [Chloroflexota bacterium]